MILLVWPFFRASILQQSCKTCSLGAFKNRRRPTSRLMALRREKGLSWLLTQQPFLAFFLCKRHQERPALLTFQPWQGPVSVGLGSISRFSQSSLLRCYIYPWIKIVVRPKGLDSEAYCDLFCQLEMTFSFFNQAILLRQTAQ